jgi:hypothetical protein
VYGSSITSANGGYGKSSNGSKEIGSTVPGGIADNHGLDAGLLRLDLVRFLLLFFLTPSAVAAVGCEGLSFDE